MNQEQSNLKELEDDEINLVEIATTLGEEKKILFGLPFVVAIIAIIVSLLLTPVYTASTTLMPSQNNNQSGAAMLLSELGGLVGSMASLGAGGNNTDMYVSMLKSRSVKNMLNKKFDLLTHYNLEFRQDLYNILDELTEIEIDKKSGLITLFFEDDDPVFAAKIANGYSDALQRLLDEVAVTEAQKKRLFFENQFAKAKVGLAQAEISLKEVQEKTGVLELEEQAKATIGAIASVRAGIAQREVMLNSIRTFATTENPDYKRTLGELAGLQEQLQKMETGSHNEKEPTLNGISNIGAINGNNLPEQGLEYIRALREVKYHEAIFEIMAKQFELAKVEEAKDGTPIQQLDYAIVPEQKSSPKEIIITIIATLASGFLGVLIALFRGELRKQKNDPEKRSRIQRLRKAWGFGS